MYKKRKLIHTQGHGGTSACKTRRRSVSPLLDLRNGMRRPCIPLQATSQNFTYSLCCQHRIPTSRVHESVREDRSGGVQDRYVHRGAAYFDLLSQHACQLLPVVVRNERIKNFRIGHVFTNCRQPLLLELCFVWALLTSGNFFRFPIRLDAVLVFPVLNFAGFFVHWQCFRQSREVQSYSGLLYSWCGKRVMA